MTPRRIHLVCNAHLDPVWLWEWEEGAAEALATFRSAARCCREFRSFVFNHNESLLYKTVEEYEPDLFEEIRSLVRAGRWHIMGGWFLQPDANMPCGESLIRQILIGKTDFRRAFGVEPTTAVNLDSFGHSRGLVQILAKSGYDSYLFCRPGVGELALPGEEFLWVGFDGSEIQAARATAHYNSRLGEARRRAESWAKETSDRPLSLLLWGVGNHGGGPSRKDLDDLERLRAEPGGEIFLHSTPEAFFKDLSSVRADLPRFTRSLNPWAPGCYTSMARVKHKLRRLENELLYAEKICAAAACQTRLPYPAEGLREAWRALAFCQFHDILPGSSIPPAEEAALRTLDFGLEIAARAKMRAMVALASGDPPAEPEEIPLLVYNPHPFPVDGLVECEFQPAEPNFEGGFLLPAVVDRQGRTIDSQPEKEHCTLSLEWRKRVVFRAELSPYALNRFSCRLKRIAAKPEPAARIENGFLRLNHGDLEVLLNARTGLLDGLRFRGRDILLRGSFEPLIMADNADPWGMTVRNFRRLAGRFRPAPPRLHKALYGAEPGPNRTVRVIEDGAVRTVVESVLGFGCSVVIHRYKIPKRGDEIEVETRVLWNEKDRMLKLRLRTPFRGGVCLGQTAFGSEELFANGDETVSQQWLAVLDRNRTSALTIVKDRIYGADFKDGELRLSLLRAPAYSADPAPGRPLVSQDRFLPRQDQGEHVFHFWLRPGEASERLAAVDREAIVRHQKPFALPFFPRGGGRTPGTFMELEDGCIQMTAVKHAEEGRELVVRLFNPTAENRRTALRLPFLPDDAPRGHVLDFRPFEIRTFRLDPSSGSLMETDLLERLPRGSVE